MVDDSHDAEVVNHSISNNIDGHIRVEHNVEDNSNKVLKICSVLIYLQRASKGRKDHVAKKGR